VSLRMQAALSGVHDAPVLTLEFCCVVVPCIVDAEVLVVLTRLAHTTLLFSLALCGLVVSWS
jgi:hypothetical protein